MPIHYDGKIYRTWGGLVKAIKKLHPTWHEGRINRYAGGLKRKQESKVNKHGK